MVVEILETKYGGAPVRADLDAWITAYKIPVTSVIDPPGVGTKTFDTYGRRENTFVVDLKTMKILKKVSGSIAGIGDSSVKQVVPYLMTLLGK
jgi:hypothetical protein